MIQLCRVRYRAMLLLLIALSGCQTTVAPTTEPRLTPTTMSRPRPPVPSILPTLPPSIEVPSDDEALPAAPASPAVVTPTAQLSALPGRLFLVRHLPDPTSAEEEVARQIILVTAGATHTLPITGVNITVSTSEKIVVSHRGLPGYASQYVQYDVQSGQLSMLPFICPILTCEDIVLSPGNQSIALTYRCMLEDFYVVLLAVAEVQAFIDSVPPCRSHQEIPISWSSDGQRVLTWTHTGLREISTNGTEQMLLPGEWERDVHVAADQRTIIAIPRESTTVRLIDWETLQQEKVRVPGHIVMDAVISPDQRYIAFSDNVYLRNPDQCIYLYDRLQPNSKPTCITAGYQVLAWLPER